MKQIDSLYNWLATLEDPEADHILAAGLDHADPPYIERIISTLRVRKTELAWKGLVANYDRLDMPTRAQVLGSDEPLLRAGVGQALASPTPRHRQNALALLIDHPQPQCAHLVSDVLRDVLPAIRESAAQVLRACAEKLLRDEAAATVENVGEASTADVRKIVIEALRNALHSFDVHFRLEILEASLWFATELRETLWDVLGTRRSHAAYAVTEQLPAWNHPRIASFLLIALGWPSWRWSAQEILDQWSTREHLRAMLKQSDLLTDPQVRASLETLKAPAWLGAAGSDLGELSPEERPLVPQWVCRVGYGEEERVRILARWRMSRYLEVQRAAIYALASIDHREAARMLADAAVRPGPMMQFPRWVLAGRRAVAVAGKNDPGASPAAAGHGAHEVDAWANS